MNYSKKLKLQFNPPDNTWAAWVGNFHIATLYWISPHEHFTVPQYMIKSHLTDQVLFIPQFQICEELLITHATWFVMSQNNQ